MNFINAFKYKEFLQWIHKSNNGEFYYFVFDY